MAETNPSHLKLALLVAALVVVVTSIPQASQVIKRGAAWEGSYALIDFDELSYSAYVNALIDGRPRRNNPYLGKESDKTEIGESYFSIQFLPAYTVALPARVLGISASTAFILLAPLMAFASSLAIFWLLYQVTRSETTAAVGVLIVLLCGRLISENPFTPEQTYSSFAFLRRYLPALPFPLFFLFCGFVWRAFSDKRARPWAWGAGLLLAALIYSYFYLWTAAAAWLLCFTIAWLIARREDRRNVVRCIAIIAGISICALGPYFYLLSQRAKTLDADQALVSSRAPDLLRVPEIIGVLILLILIVYVRRGRVELKSPPVLFVAACAATPLVVFNQQVLTGLSLQSFHYEQFIINYVVLVALVAAYHLFLGHLKIRPLVWAAFALIVGFVTAVKEVRDNSALNIRRDEAKPIFEKLDQSQSNGLALFNNSLLAASALTDSSVPQLWAPNMYIYGGVDEAERLERFYQYLYLLGVGPEQLERDLHNSPQVRAAVFGLHRANPSLTKSFTPVTADEIRARVESYSTFAKSFSREHVTRRPLAYVIMLDDQDYDFTNLDRWYTRSGGEKVGNSVVYSVQLRE